MVQDRLTMIRGSGISRANFRAGLIELGKFISYEFANTLEKQYLTVKTPLGSTECVIIKENVMWWL